MDRIVIAGIDTEVGKTIVSAIITTMLKADYWKPIQSGAKQTDAQTLSNLLSKQHRIFPPAYTLKAPLSPHHAARLENITIDSSKITPPRTNRSLIIEMAGGILVPINQQLLSIDLFHSWSTKWILVSKHYLGSINHTLLTLEALKSRNICPNIVFNGDPNPDSEKAILSATKAPLLGRLLPEKQISPSTIQRYAQKWQQ